MPSGFFDDLPDLGLPDQPMRRRRLPTRDEDGIPVVYYVKVRCPNPNCGSDDCPVYSSDDLPIRRHRCKKCGGTFKSIEK